MAVRKFWKENKVTILITILTSTLVGFLFFIPTVIIPILLEKHMELSYYLEEPKDVSNQYDQIPGTTFAYTVNLKNTGELSIKNIIISYVFWPIPEKFQMISASHRPTPIEFGGIENLEYDDNSWRFSYELLNPGEELSAIFFVNYPGITLKVYSKTEGVEFKEIDFSKSSIEKYYPLFMTGLISLISLLLYTFISRLFGRRLIYDQPLYRYSRLTRVGNLMITQLSKGIRINLKDFSKMGKTGEFENQVHILKDEYKWIIVEGDFAEITKKGKEELASCGLLLEDL